MNNPNSEPKLNENPKERRKAAWSALLGGLSMMGAATIGVMSNEATTPQEAMGSISISDRTYYVEAEEIPFIALGALGAIAAISAAEYLRKPEEE